MSIIYDHPSVKNAKATGKNPNGASEQQPPEARFAQEISYNSFYGLDETPFSIAPNPRFLFMSEQHQEALAHLLYGVNAANGFVLLTGEVGTGKTTVIRAFLQHLPDDARVAYVLHASLTAQELLETIAEELNIQIEKEMSHRSLVAAIHQKLLEHHGAGFRTFLLIDEAQNLAAEVLEEIRLLTNLETDDGKLLHIILVGQPELRDMFQAHCLRQLNQRITARYHLQQLSQTDVVLYLQHRLAVAQASRNPFTAKAMKAIARVTQGIPRLVNMVADRALLAGFARQEFEIDHLVIKAASQEIFGQISLWQKLKAFQKRLFGQNRHEQVLQQGRAPGLQAFSIGFWLLVAAVASGVGLIGGAIIWNSPENEPVYEPLEATPVSNPEEKAVAGLSESKTLNREVSLDEQKQVLVDPTVLEIVGIDKLTEMDKKQGVLVNADTQMIEGDSSSNASSFVPENQTSFAPVSDSQEIESQETEGQETEGQEIEGRVNEGNTGTPMNIEESEQIVSVQKTVESAATSDTPAKPIPTANEQIQSPSIGPDVLTKSLSFNAGLVGLQKQLGFDAAPATSIEELGCEAFTGEIGCVTISGRLESLLKLDTPFLFKLAPGQLRSIGVTFEPAPGESLIRYTWFLVTGFDPAKGEIQVGSHSWRGTMSVADLSPVLNEGGQFLLASPLSDLSHRELFKIEQSQWILTRIGFSDGSTLDPIFDLVVSEQTYNSAVKGFQARQNLQEDGLFGVRTLIELNRFLFPTMAQLLKPK